MKNYSYSIKIIFTMEADHPRFKPKIHNSYFSKSLVNIGQFLGFKTYAQNFCFRTI